MQNNGKPRDFWVIHKKFLDSEMRELTQEDFHRLTGDSAFTHAFNQRILNKVEEYYRTLRAATLLSQDQTLIPA